MKGRNVLVLLTFAVLALGYAACGDDDYHYPSVVVEYLTAETDSEGAYHTVVTDKGLSFPVLDNRTDTRGTADSVYRIVGNYERITSADGTEGVRLYATINTISSVPEDSTAFEKGVRTDVCHKVLSMWPGYNYLNLIILVRQKGAHTFHFVEDSVRTDTTDAALRTVHLTFYHAAITDVQDYQKRVYLSIPLRGYLTDGVKRLRIRLRIHTDNGMETREAFYDEESF